MKTDNHNPRAKLDLRRYFLRKYHATEPIHVMDCCQGSGLLWGTLADEFPLASYWGLDMKPKKGRLKLDSARVLAQPGWTQNVIDIDTYGSPWKHWLAMLPNVRGPVTVFLTIGRYGPNLVSISAVEFNAIGLTFERVKKMHGMCSALAKIVLGYVLAEVHQFGILITEAIEALPCKNARYIGLRLEKRMPSALVTPAASSTTPTLKGA